MFKNSKTKAQCIVIVTFLLGAFSGGLVTYLVQNQQTKQTTTVLDEINRRVSMQPEQRTQVEAILRDARQQNKNLKIQHRPEFDAIREAARGKVRNLLNSEQQARFDQYMKELDAKREAARQAETVSK